MLDASHALKSRANAQFAKQDYTSAIGTYDRALAELPNYLDYEMAVLQSNIAACHLKLEQWKEAVEACDRGLDGLEREMPIKPKSKGKASSTKNGDKDNSSRKSRGGKRSNGKLNSDTESEPSSPTIRPQDVPNADNNDAVVELPADVDEATALQNLALSDSRKADIHRIRTKLLLRRARARSSLPNSSSGSQSTSSSIGFSSNWSTLSAALEDYTLLSKPEYFQTLPPSDQKTVLAALKILPPRVNEAKEKEVGEMMGKLKDLGNGILKPFGLSTDMFKVTQGEGGGYSLSFDSGGSGQGKMP